MASVTTAMLCKEQGITVTGICAVYELFVVQKVRTRFYCIHKFFLFVFRFSFFFPFSSSFCFGMKVRTIETAQVRNVQAIDRKEKGKIFCEKLFRLFVDVYNNNHFQISVRSMAHLMRCILNGKRFTLSSSAWTTESKKRLIVLFLTTIGLLFARFKVMGSQLPVFTR